jgi:hypothetical protein
LGRYSEKYSEDQRRAIGSALVDPDPISGKLRTVPQVRKLLEAGELRYQGERIDPPATPVPTSTFYNLKTREQQRRKGEILSPLAQQALENPEAVRERIIQMAISAWETEQERLNEQIRKGKTIPSLFTQQMRNAATVKALLGKPRGHVKPKADPNPGEPPEKRPDELTSLIKAHEGRARGVTA